MEYREIEISCIKQSKYNPSIRTDRSNKKYSQLKTSISKNGLITPVTCGVGKKNILLVAGHRRVNCFIDLGYKKIPAFINPAINDDAMFVVENQDSMQLSAAQETERYLQGAPVVTPSVLDSIKRMEIIGGGRRCIERIVKEKKSPNTYLIAINKYTSYIKDKSLKSQKACLYWMFNVGTAYQIKVAIDTFINANLLKNCIDDRRRIEAIWKQDDNIFAR